MRQVRGRLRSGVLVAAVLLWAVAAEAQSGYTGSIYVVRFDTTDGTPTDAMYLFSSVDAELGPLRVAATVPVVAQRLTSVTTAGTVSAGSWTVGFADPTLRADVRIWQSASRGTSLRASGSVKLPIAGVEDGFSTGETDYAVGLAGATFRGRHSLLADVTLWILGDPPDVEFRNVISFYVGYGRILDIRYRWSAIVSLSGSRSAVLGFAPPVQVSAALLRSISAHTALGLSIDAGLTSGAATIAVGTTWRIGF